MATNANIGTPIELDLGGRGIRSIDRNTNNQYLIIAGLPDAATATAPKDFRLCSWTGNPSDPPELLLTDLTGLNTGLNIDSSLESLESIVEVPIIITKFENLVILNVLYKLYPSLKVYGISDIPTCRLVLAADTVLGPVPPLAIAAIPVILAALPEIFPEI